LVIWLLKKKTEKINANRLSELASVDFEFSLDGEEVEASAGALALA
jgi:hypothetical protein